MNTSRDYLVYCPTSRAGPTPELFGDNRLFDIALNFYEGTTPGLPRSPEYSFRIPGYKLYTAKTALEPLYRSYSYIALLDDDLDISTETLNALFLYGAQHNLTLYQPALEAGSYYSWKHTLKQKQQAHRRVPFVEMMAPFFKQEALDACLPYFQENQSGWGLDDYLWPKLLGKQNLYVVDCHTMQHRRPLQSEGFQLENGKSPLEEKRELFIKHATAYERVADIWHRIIHKLRRTLRRME